MYIHIVRNIKSCQSQMILKCVFLSRMCLNHPKSLTSQKRSSRLGLFVRKVFMALLFLVGGWTLLSACCFIWSTLQKSIENTTNSSRNFQKTAKCSRTHKKKQILFHRFLDEYTQFLIPLLFVKGRNEKSKNG